MQSYHGGMWEIGVVLLLVGTLLLIASPRLFRRRAVADALSGTLLVTGVSPRPDATGEQFVTVTGVINGPTVTEHPIYYRTTVDVNDWPSMGQLLPVLYSQKNPDNWQLAPPPQ